MEIVLPERDEFSQKLVSAIRESGKEQYFLRKWGLKGLSEVRDILNDNIQGGYDSHSNSILSTVASDSVLIIGPGIGFCVFLLSELYDYVYVAEPDRENCSLIRNVSKYYVTDQQRKASDIVRILHAGISITDEAVEYWYAKRREMEKRNIIGSILNFVIEGASELNSIFHEKVSRVYLHKVLSSLSISDTFENVIRKTLLFIKEGGVITWSEPDYIFKDLLLLPDQDDISVKLESLFGRDIIDFEIMNYILSSRINHNIVFENWIILNGTKI